jgi:hypothetical protein
MILARKLLNKIRFKPFPACFLITPKINSSRLFNLPFIPFKNEPAYAENFACCS